MAVNLNACYNSDFKAFVDFATSNVNKGQTKAIVRVDAKAGNPLSNRNIKAATGDRIGSGWFRSDVNMQANNEARSFFMKAVEDMFPGGIPQSVLDAMKLSDFGEGKPLTARRIVAVQKAVDAVLKPDFDFNNDICNNISSGSIKLLPEKMQACLAKLVSDLRTQYGNEAVPPDVTIDKIVPAEFMAKVVGGLRDVANSQRRVLTASEITAAYARFAPVALDIKAALDGAGITNDKVRSDVMMAMLERTRAVFAKSPSQDELAAHLDKVKTDAAEFGKTLDAFAKAMENVRDDAAARVGDSTGLDKEYVKNNLRLDGIAFSSGKLSLNYSGILGNAKNGIDINHAEMREKATDIVVQFANKKIEIIKEIDKAGFGAAERAERIEDALRNPDFTDSRLVTAAKNLAGNAVVKNSMRILAEQLKPDVVSNLDDDQLCSAFLLFGGVLFTTLEAGEFKDQFKEWRDSTVAMDLLLGMTVELMTKDMPQLPETLAKLGASGRIDKLNNKLTAGIADLNDICTDYLTLQDIESKYKDNPNLAEGFRGFVKNKDLVFNEADMMKRDYELRIYNATSTFAGKFLDGYNSVEMDKASVRREAGKPKYENRPVENKTFARKTTGKFIFEKYTEGLPQEKVSILAKLADTLDWRRTGVEKSQAYFHDVVEELKSPRPVLVGLINALEHDGVKWPGISAIVKDFVADLKSVSEEMRPLLDSLVNGLERDGVKWKDIPAIVKKFAADIKTWCNVKLGSADSKGLADVLLRRKKAYLNDVLAGKALENFNKKHDLFQTFLRDLSSNNYIINGQKAESKDAEGKVLNEDQRLNDRLPSFLNAIKDPVKRKVVSVMVNQQLFAELSTAIPNRFSLPGLNGTPEVPFNEIPDIDKFASRDFKETGRALLGKGSQTYEITVGEDEKTVTVRARYEAPLLTNHSKEEVPFAKCTYEMEFVIDFNDAKPEIKDMKLGQTLSAIPA